MLDRFRHRAFAHARRARFEFIDHRGWKDDRPGRSACSHRRGVHNATEVERRHPAGKRDRVVNRALHVVRQVDRTVNVRNGGFIG